VGIDKVTKDEYGKDLEANLENLLKMIRQGSYHPKASRIHEVAKADGSMRPLAISCFEDKIVQEAAKQIVERIFEPIFLECSHGFRPNRSCHTALIALNRHLMSWNCGAVLEIDLQKYFNTIPHEPLIRMLKLKISDDRFLHLIIKLLKAPVQKSDGSLEQNEMGSPQGSILSPVLANIYLHYVLDLWFRHINNREYQGTGQMVRYADDAVFTFKTLAAAETFRKQLIERLSQFGIAINEAKTQAIINGPRGVRACAKEGMRMPVFSFLGFLHVWGKGWNRKEKISFWRVKRRTCPVRFRKKLAAIQAYIKLHRHDKVLVVRLKAIVIGYLNYFAINDNAKRVDQFIHQVTRMLFKWWNRRSEKRNLSWDKFAAILKKVNFPTSARFKNLFFNSSSASL
jgi:group II intron reverse transcriptase/maturase